MTDQYTEEQLEHLRRAPLEDVVPWHLERMASPEPADLPSLAEVRLWIREALARADAEEAAEYIGACRSYIEQWEPRGDLEDIRRLHRPDPDAAA